MVLKTTYIIAPSLLRLATLNPAMIRLFVVYHKGQSWVHSYFYFILMTCLTARRNYHFEFLLMTQICFTQVISCNIFSKKYCITNKLSINLTKTNYMVISSSRLNGSIHIYIYIKLNVKVK